MHFIYDELLLLAVDLSLSELTRSSFIESPTFRPYLHSAFSRLSGGENNILLCLYITLHKEACRDRLDGSRVCKSRCLNILSPELLNEFWLIMTYVYLKFIEFTSVLKRSNTTFPFLWGILRLHFRSAFLFNRGMALSCFVPLTVSLTLEMRLFYVYGWRRSSKWCFRVDHMQMKAQKFPVFGFISWRPHCYRSLCIEECWAEGDG